MARPPFEVAQILRDHGEEYLAKYSPSPEQHKVMRAISICRTAVLGGHVEECDSCGHREISYNSCRNRHCPKCQSLAKAKWLEERSAELLPVEYYHVVFTVPHEVAELALQNKRTVYNILFRAVSKTLLTIAADEKHLGARIGFLAILHTWGQNLMHHPHLHCVVPGGGLSKNGKEWIACRKGFFLPVRVLSRLFRRLCLEELEKAFKEGALSFHGSLKYLEDEKSFKKLLDECRKVEWVVYAKPPFSGPEKVLDYLSRYTHRVAVSNHRILKLEDGKVTFKLKDYAEGGKRKTMTLKAVEFIRRFLLHALPDGFMRIRYYGLMANRHRADKLRLCRKLLSAGDEKEEQGAKDKATWSELLERLVGDEAFLCPACKKGRLVIVETVSPSTNPRAPPELN